jgi:molecular chaperone GrpE
MSEKATKAEAKEMENQENDTVTNAEEQAEVKAQESVEQEDKQEEVSEVDKLKAEVNNLKDQHLRLYAEFENHRKRTAKERLELFGTKSGINECLASSNG